MYDMNTLPKKVVFKERERRVMLALAEVATPRRAGEPVLGAEKIVAAVEDFVGAMPASAIRGIRALALILEFLAVLVLFGIRPFTKLTKVEKEKYLRELLTSRFYIFRSVAVTLNGFVQLVAYEDPEIARDVGYDPEAYKKELGS